MRLSIIVPVYNVEQYVRLCLESLFQQGLDEQDVEVIIVNDGTQDRSMEVIQDIICLHQNITVISQDNLGLSAARNTGLVAAKGDYVLFVDSDDLLIDNSLPAMLDDACRHKPDLLIAKFVTMNNDDISSGQIPSTITYASTAIAESRATIEYLNPQECYVWRTLYKRAFLNEHAIRFIPGIYFEDVPFTAECYLKSMRCLISNYPFYIYRQHHNSIVSTINKKKVMDLNVVIAHLCDMRHWHLSPIDHKKLMKLIFLTYQIQAWYISHNKELLAERKEITSDLKKKVPNLRFCGGLKEIIVSLFYQLMPNTSLLMRSLLT